MRYIDRCDCCDYDKFYMKPDNTSGPKPKVGLYCQRCGKLLMELKDKEVEYYHSCNVPYILYGKFGSI